MDTSVADRVEVTDVHLQRPSVMQRLGWWTLCVGLMLCVVVGAFWVAGLSSAWSFGAFLAGATIWAAGHVGVVVHRGSWPTRLGVIAAVGLAAGLGVSVGWMGFPGFVLLFLGIGAAVVTALVAGVVRIGGTSRPPSLFVPALTIVVSGAVALIASVLTADPAPLFDPLPDGVSRLEHLESTDQEDQWSGVWLFAPQRNDQRIDHVLDLYRGGALVTPHDAYLAARILQHGSCVDEFEIAHELALEAAAGGVADAAVLARQSEDRLQLALGNPQVHGTQFQPIPIERPCDEG